LTAEADDGGQAQTQKQCKCFFHVSGILFFELVTGGGRAGRKAILTEKPAVFGVFSHGLAAERLCASLMAKVGWKKGGKGLLLFTAGGSGQGERI
jgi:hypothetical protein